MESSIWKFLKYLSLILIAVLFVILIAQFINMSNLTNKNNELKYSLTSMTEEQYEKQARYDDLNENYNKYVEDTAKEELNMKKQDEEVIISKN